MHESNQKNVKAANKTQKELDLSRLNRIAAKAPGRPQDGPDKEDDGKQQNGRRRPPEGLAGALEGMERLQRDADRELRAERRAAKAYEHYQKNIQTANRIQIEIARDVKRGENAYALFLKAVKAISLMTGDDLFYSQIEASIMEIHGSILLEAPMEDEIRAVEGRLGRLEESLKRMERDGEDEDTKRRVAGAIAEHEKRVGELKGLLEPGNS